MDVYFLATRVQVPKECVDCQTSAILYQPETVNPPPPDSSSPYNPQTGLHPERKPDAKTGLGPLEVNDPPFRETLFK